MTSLLTLLVLGASLIISADNTLSATEKTGTPSDVQVPLTLPYLPGANQHVRLWPGNSGDGRVLNTSRSAALSHPMASRNGIAPISTVTLLQGWFVRNYTDRQWQLLFRTFASQGIKSVVFATSVDEMVGPGQVLGTPNAYPAGLATAWYSVSKQVKAAYPKISYPGNASGASRSPSEECLYYAQHNGVNNAMTVYVGLNFYPSAWGYRSGNVNGSGRIDPITDSAFCSFEAKLGLLVASDINKQLGGYSSFAGWYWPWEVDNIYFDKNIGDSESSFLPTGYAASAYNNLISMLAESFVPLSSKPRLISPFFNPYYQHTKPCLPYSAYTATEYGNLWQQIFTTTYYGSPIFSKSDIFAPQDAAGAYEPKISDSSSMIGPPSIPTVVSVINEWYPPLLQAASSIPGMQVWANADTFQVDVEEHGDSPIYVENAPIYSPTPWINGAFVQAGFNRIAAQFQAESAVNYGSTYRVSRIMNCSNAYYYDPLSVWSNPAWNIAWGTWQANQTLGNSRRPGSPRISVPRSSNGHCYLKLAVDSSPTGVCGFCIWRDSYTPGTTPYVYCEIPVSPSSSITFVDPDPASNSANHTYTIAAFDVYGNLSAITQFTHTR